jgi:hypothetical protein
VNAGHVEVKPKYFGLRRIDLIPLLEGTRGEGKKDTSSVTLVKTPTTTVVIDTGSKDVREELLQAMEKNHVNVKKVNVLVTTRVDPIHNGNDDTFVHALQHLRREEWNRIEPGPRRKVAISDRYHWIDRYLKLEVVNFPEPGGIVLLLHFPRSHKLITIESKMYTGQIVGITGMSVPSENDPEVKAALDRIRSGDGSMRPGRSQDINDLESLLSYCDHIIPAYGPMFKVYP